MTLLSLVIGIAQIVYNDILDGMCNFYLKVLYGIEVITLFSITAIIAYYMRNLIYDIYEFAIHQTLLSEAVKKKRNYFITITAVLFITYLLIYIIVSAFFVSNQKIKQFTKLNATCVYV